MRDLVTAALLLASLIARGVVAPSRGVDSRDGVESDQPARRASWLGGRS